MTACFVLSQRGRIHETWIFCRPVGNLLKLVGRRDAVSRLKAAIRLALSGCLSGDGTDQGGAFKL